MLNGYSGYIIFIYQKQNRKIPFYISMLQQPLIFVKRLVITKPNISPPQKKAPSRQLGAGCGLGIQPLDTARLMGSYGLGFINININFSEFFNLTIIKLL